LGQISPAAFERRATHGVTKPSTKSRQGHPRGVVAREPRLY